MSQYGYTRKKVAVIESTTQVMIEEASKNQADILDSIMMDRIAAPSPKLNQKGHHADPLSHSKTTSNSIVTISPTAGGMVTSSRNQVQHETRRQDGKKRIQPILLRGGSEESIASSQLPGNTSYDSNSMMTIVNPLKRKGDADDANQISNFKRQPLDNYVGEICCLYSYFIY